MRGKLADVPVSSLRDRPRSRAITRRTTGKYRMLGWRGASRRAAPDCRADRSPRSAIRFGDSRLPSRCGTDAGTRDGRKRALPPGALRRLSRKRFVRQLSRREQTLLSSTARGFARSSVRDCGHVAECPHCSVSSPFTARNLAACITLRLTPVPRPVVPECSGSVIGRSHGTEKIEAAVRVLLPSARVARLDRDTGAARASSAPRSSRGARASSTCSWNAD